jgi:hypothetical protein
MDFFVHKTPSDDTNVLPKVVFDKTAFVKFKISNNFNQNIDKTDSNPIHRKIYTSLWVFTISRKKSATKSLETSAKSL